MKLYSTTRRRFLSAAAAAPAILSHACAKARECADMVCRNGSIVTLDGDGTIAETVAIKDGRFMAAGSEKDMLKLAGPGTEDIDLAGNMALPGLIEGHAHPETAAVSEMDSPVPNPRTVDECLAWIREQAAQKEKGEWISHFKLFPTRLREMKPPSLARLDNASPQNPVFLNASYGAVVNSAALRASGIEENTRHNGLLRDPVTGKLNGRLLHTAFGLLKRPKAVQPTDMERASCLREMHRRYNSVGFTSVVSGGIRGNGIDIYEFMRAQEALTIRATLNIYAPFSVPGTERDTMKMALADLGVRSGGGDRWVNYGTLKTTVDGGILTGTAYLREPWGAVADDIYGTQEPGYRGIPRMNAEEFAAFAAVGADCGWRVTAHCTGGGGVDIMLDGYEAVSRERDLPPGTFTIIHGNFYTPEAMAKTARLNVTAEMQPAWFYKDADAMLHILGEERIKTFHPYRSMIDAGVLVSAGSDHMIILDDRESINPYSPWLAMFSMITRKTEHGTTIVPGEAITRKEALECYTVNTARACFQGEVKGNVQSGKYADMIVIDRDFFRCPEEEIADVKVLKTIVDGKIVHEI